MAYFNEEKTIEKMVLDMLGESSLAPLWKSDINPKLELQRAGGLDGFA
ncbi:hypothetical protein [Mariprofundus erugo]|nr:hypothetical protein [Mariprofundus erugo]